MTDDRAGESPQAQLHTALQTTAHEDDDLEGSVLAGWVTIAEWISPDGERWISSMANEGSAQWQTAGYLHYALQNFGPSPEDDE